MSSPIKIISTDFDGTLFAEFENPPIPDELQRLIGELQAQGLKWVINTGRDMSSLMESLARAGIELNDANALYRTSKQTQEIELRLRQAEEDRKQAMVLFELPTGP